MHSSRPFSAHQPNPAPPGVKASQRRRDAFATAPLARRLDGGLQTFMSRASWLAAPA
jgi:hypothetical protein